MKGMRKNSSRRALRLAVQLLTAAIVVAAALPFALPARVAHAQNPGFTEFPLTSGYDRPQGIVAGPDGNLWFSETTGPNIGKITPSGTITEYPVPSNGSFVQTPWITGGPDGNLWFSDWGNNAIGKSTTAGSVTEYPIPTSGAGPYVIVTGSDGNLWFVEYNADKVGRITTSGTITEFPIASGSGAQVIAAGPDGNVWVTETSLNEIAQITPSGTVTQFPTGSGSGPFGIAAGPDGNIWFIENGTSNVAKMSTSGALLAEYPILTSNANLQDLTVGPDGKLWFAEYGGNAIGSITTGGTVTEYSTGFSSGPLGITSGPDGNMWYTGYAGPSIGRFSLNSCANVTDSASQSPIGSGAPETVAISLTSCGLAALQNATTTTTTTVPSGCPAAAAIPSFTSSLSLGQTEAHRATFTAPSCAGTYMVMSQTTVGSTVMATASTTYVVLGIGDGIDYPTDTRPTYVAAGSDGNMWYTDYQNLIRVTVPAGTVSYFSMSGIGNPGHIASGFDGNVYVDMGRKIAQMALGSPPTLGWEVPVTGSINDVEPGPDGNIWFTTQTSTSSGLVGFVTPGAKVKMFKAPSGQGVPQSIAAGPDGALWYTLDSGQVGRLTTGGVTTALYPIVGGLGVSGGGGLALGPDGNLWFTAADPFSGQNYIVRMAPTGAMQKFATPTVSPNAGGITAGADGNVWFNEPFLRGSCQFGGGVGRVTLSGAVTEYGAGCDDTNDQFNIAAGPDGNVWNAAYYGIGANMAETGASPSCTPLRATPSATSVSPGSTETIATSVNNCARTLQLMHVQTKTIPPSGCGTATTTHVNVPLGPRLGTTVTTSAVAPSCAGTYKVTSKLSVGSTVIGSITVTYQVT